MIDFTRDYLNTLTWSPIPGPTDDEDHAPAEVTFGHAQLFMILRSKDFGGIGFTHQEGVGLLKMMAERLPLEALSQLR